MSPVPFREFVLKIASRCNLACDYCYVYTGPDQTWRAQPLVMSTEVIETTARQIGEHARAHRLDRVRVGLHGGEPLLAGQQTVERAISALRSAAPAGTLVELTVQTNGTLLDEGYLRLLARHRVRVGISLDGSARSNDKHRIHADGRSSFPAVARSAGLLASEQYRQLFSGILCTIDLANDPVETYRSLLGHHPPMIDFLLPHANWSQPPPGAPDPDSARYAGWLIPVFDAWYTDSAPAADVRLFTTILRLLLGGRSGIETVGGSPLAYAVVQTDGAIEASDSLRTAYDGAAATGMSVFTSSFDEALRHPAFTALQDVQDQLCATCLSCPVLTVCGGGQYAHRYRAGAGFGRPSVYCADLTRLIGHIAGRVRADLRAASAR